jgi:hypothetical protein
MQFSSYHKFVKGFSHQEDEALKVSAAGMWGPSQPRLFEG